MNWTMAGALWGLVGVGLGAFGAHGLKASGSRSRRSPGGRPRRATSSCTPWPWSCSALLQQNRPGGDAVGWSFLLGSALFSGTLYAMALGAPRWLGAITPIGGLGMMLGWLLLALHARR